SSSSTATWASSRSSNAVMTVGQLLMDLLFNHVTIVCRDNSAAESLIRTTGQRAHFQFGGGAKEMPSGKQTNTTIAHRCARVAHAHERSRQCPFSWPTIRGTVSLEGLLWLTSLLLMTVQ